VTVRRGRTILSLARMGCTQAYARLVVTNSLRLGAIEVGNGSKAEHAGLMRDAMIALMKPF
jgi:hypothetical protein